MAPKGATSIPRLELCASVNASQAASYVANQMDLKITNIVFYTDSKIVMAYIGNPTKSFTKYVTRRVDLILSNSNPHQWNYISTHENVADIATRPKSAAKLMTSVWLNGPDHLWEPKEQMHKNCPSVDDSLLEIDERPVILKTSITECIITKLVVRCGTWMKLVGVTMKVVYFVYKLLDKIRGSDCLGTSNILNRSLNLIFINVQRNSCKLLLNCMNSNKQFLSSPFANVSPFLDDEGVVRAGGRLRKSDMPFHQKHPILLPENHHVTQLILSHYHIKTEHQGRHVTLGSIRSAGFYTVRMKRAVRDLIHKCVSCRKLRA